MVIVVVDQVVEVNHGYDVHPAGSVRTSIAALRRPNHAGVSCNFGDDAK